MRRLLTALLMTLLCAGLADGALGHVHLWHVWSDGHVQMTHGDAGALFASVDAARERSLDLAAQHQGHLDIATSSEQGAAAAAVSLPFPSVKALPSPVIETMRRHRDPATQRGVFDGAVRTGPPPPLLHLTMVLLR